jgi:hypothetical protein
MMSAVPVMVCGTFRADILSMVCGIRACNLCISYGL